MSYAAAPALPSIPRVNVLGVGVSAINMPIALETIERWIDTGEQHYVCITGVHGVMESQADEVLRRIHNRAGLVTPDGMPMVWLSWLHGERHVDRVYGPDLLAACCERSITRGYRHFFYGGGDGVVERLVERLRARFPGLQVVGTYTPPFRPLTDAEDGDVVRRINDAEPDIVWIGLSTPKQERWMAEHAGRVRAPVLVGVGAAFDFHAGLKKQAPRWMQRAGFEWLFRLATEPRRLWRRYLVNNPAFVWRVLLQTAHVRTHPLVASATLCAAPRRSRPRLVRSPARATECVEREPDATSTRVMIPKRRLGSRGPEISAVGVGSWAIGGPYEFGWGPVDDEQSIAAIRHAVESGVNWVDTAPVYGKGHSEEVVGRALEPYRTGEDVFVFTKCGRNYYGSTGKISSDLRPETIRWECEQSLKRLKVERIDLLQFHWPDRDTGTPIEDSWATLGELIDEGKVRWGGLSNCDVPLLERCEAVRHVDSLQPPLNLINRAARNDVVPWCDSHGVGVIVYAPMASGLLTGTFDRARIEGLPNDDWRRRAANFNEPRLSQNLALVERLAAIADESQIGLPALAVAWTLSIPGVTGAIVGARSPEQVDGWLPAARARLSTRALDEIESAIVVTGAGDERSVVVPLSARRD